MYVSDRQFPYPEACSSLISKIDNSVHQINEALTGAGASGPSCAASKGDTLMRYRIGLTVVIALASIAMMIAGSGASFAQASSSTAELRGQVADANGAAIPNAKLTLTDLVKGSSRVAASDSEGNYAFLGLLPSSYDLKVEAQGFGATTTRLELTVGKHANIPIKLTAGKIEIQVDVVGGGEVLETSRTEQASTVDSKQITSLPINRRSFLDYALLTPGVTSSENITDATDYRVAQTAPKPSALRAPFRRWSLRRPSRSSRSSATASAPNSAELRAAWSTSSRNPAATVFTAARSGCSVTRSSTRATPSISTRRGNRPSTASNTAAPSAALSRGTILSSSPPSSGTVRRSRLSSTC